MWSELTAQKMSAGSLCRRAKVWQLLAFMLLATTALPGKGSAAPLWDAVGFIRQPHFTGEGAAACLSCHFGKEMQAIAASPHGNAANPAAPYSREACESCHGPGSFHVSRAHGGKGFPELLRFGRGSGFSSREEQLHACLACHEDRQSGATVIGFTGSAHDRNSINCSRCHALHAQTQSMNQPLHQSTVCFSCHYKQREGHPFPGAGLDDFAEQSCGKCHDVHPVARQ